VKARLTLAISLQRFSGVNREKEKSSMANPGASGCSRCRREKEKKSCYRPQSVKTN
jgi:hypothetical protein